MKQKNDRDTPHPLGAHAVTNEPKACPFCGHIGATRCYEFVDGQTWFWYECGDCHARGPRSREFVDVTPRARWDRRSQTREATIEECAKVCDDYEASLHAIGGASMVGAIHCAQRIRSLASHPASEAGEARPSVDVKALRAEMLNALANEWPMFRDASDECESKRMDYDEAELFVREAFDIAVKKLGAALYERGAK